MSQREKIIDRMMDQIIHQAEVDRQKDLYRTVLGYQLDRVLKGIVETPNANEVVRGWATAILEDRL